MNRPLYSAARGEQRPDGQFHRGLWFERFFDCYDPSWQVLEGGKPAWIKTVEGHCGDSQELDRHTRSLARRVQCLGGEVRGFRTDWHFATGLGLPHPVENGFLWHPTLGVPYLPGTAVKGLVRAWVECWTDTEGGQTPSRWFETADECDQREGAGDLIFFDGLPSGPVTLTLDVMTPHYGKWYEQGGQIQDPEKEPEKVPADWHDPHPIPFLTVKEAAFIFAIAPRRPEFGAEVQPALEALAEALKWLGAGAKTAVGYGRMQRDDGIVEQIEKKLEQECREAEALRRETEHLRQRALLSPVEQDIESVIEHRPDPQLQPFLALFQALEQQHWQGDDARQVAVRVRALMQAEKGRWKEKSDSKKPEKDKDHQRTLAILRWLNQ